MRLVDAPREGWYPDPDGRERLRWWDGLDWTDIRRAPPSSAELTRAEANMVHEAPSASSQQFGQQQMGGYSRQETQEIIAEVRNVARQELDRAANEFSHRATTAVRSVTPLITDYTSKMLRWIKIALVLAVVLFIVWMTFQAIASQSLFDWIGERIDNLTEETTALPALLRGRGSCNSVTPGSGTAVTQSEMTAYASISTRSAGSISATTCTRVAAGLTSPNTSPCARSTPSVSSMSTT